MTGQTAIRVLRFEVEGDPWVEAFARRVPALLHGRLATVAGLRARLDLDHASPSLPQEFRCEGVVAFPDTGPRLGARPLLCSVTLFRGDQELLRRGEAIQPRQLYRRVFALADAVVRELGLATPKARAPRGPRSFVALRDYLRATDLDDGRQALAREDQRLAVEWLLLSVEADPQFEPARDALLTTVLRAHQAGLHREARRAVYLAARLAPRDPRVPYVHGELAALDEAPDEAMAAFERCLRLSPGHRDANFKLGLLLDANGDRERAKEHFRVAGRRGRVEALLLLGMLCAEDGERRKARRAFARASALDPDGAVGTRAESSLALLKARRPRRRRSA